jgi:hypothetical protein
MSYIYIYDFSSLRVNKVDNLHYPWYSILVDAYLVTTSFLHMARTSKMNLCFHVLPPGDKNCHGVISTATGW